MWIVAFAYSKMTYVVVAKPSNDTEGKNLIEVHIVYKNKRYKNSKAHKV